MDHMLIPIGLLIAALGAYLVARNNLYIFGASVLAIGVGVLTGQNIPRYYRLANDGVTAKAVVIYTTCPQHGSFRFRYETAQGALEAGGNADFGNPLCADLRAGDPVIVTYLPDKPEVTVAGRAKDRLHDEMFSSGLAVVVAPLFFVLVCRARQKKQPNSETT